MTEKEVQPCPWCKKEPFLMRNYSRTLLAHKCEVIEIVIGWGKKKEILAKWNEPLRK